MAVDQFCLKWNNFQSSIITAFESLQNTEDLADVTLTCEGINVKAHKIILSACSPYFRTVFKENPCPHPIVILKDVFYVDLLAVLNFMYHGEVLVSKDHLKSFLQTAEVLQVSGLNGYTDFNTKNVPTKNVSKVQKSSRAVEDTVAKKIKMSPKSKLTKTPSPSASSESIPISNNTHLKKDNPREPMLIEDFEVVQVGKIKTEISEDDYHTDSKSVEPPESAISDKTKQQSSILEAALDAKEQGHSILERSLMSTNTTVKSPSASVTLPIEHVAILQTSPDIPKTVFIPRKPPEDFENTQLKQKLSDATFDLSAEIYRPTVKIETDPSKTFDLNIDPTVQGDVTLQFSRNPDLQAHHSSQCGNCPHCGKIYSNQSALKYHVRLVHSDLTNMYCCHLCPEAFDYREGYKKHMVEVHSIRN